MSQDSELPLDIGWLTHLVPHPLEYRLTPKAKLCSTLFTRFLDKVNYLISIFVENF
jgi:hypothetical protein